MKNILVLGWVLTWFYAPYASAQSYTFVKEANNIQLFERWIINESKQKVRELKVVYTINAGIASIIQLLQHPTKGKEWNHKAAVYKTINLTKNQWLTYFKYDMPLLMADQDCLLLYHYPVFTPALHDYAINFKSHHSSLFPISKDIQRITGVAGQWKLVKLNNQLTQVNYIISSDKNTKIPKAVADPIVYNNLLQSMSAFKKLIEL